MIYLRNKERKIFMKKYTLSVEGMMCSHCEAHMNDAVRKNFEVESVESSAAKKQCIIKARDIDETKLKSVIAETGYELREIKSEPYEKSGLRFKFGRKNK